MICYFKQIVIHLLLTRKIDMETVALKKQTAFRLSPELVERLKLKAEKEHRSLNNYVEMVLMSAVEDDPNEVTASAMRDAREGRSLETLDLKKFKEFVAAL